NAQRNGRKASVAGVPRVGHHRKNLLEARVVIDDFKYDHNRRHFLSALGYLTRPTTLPGTGTPTKPGGMRDQLNPEQQKHTTVIPGGHSNGDWPVCDRSRQHGRRNARRIGPSNVTATGAAGVRGRDPASLGTAHFEELPSAVDAFQLFQSTVG